MSTDEGAFRVFLTDLNIEWHTLGICKNDKGDSIFRLVLPNQGTQKNKNLYLDFDVPGGNFIRFIWES